MTTIARFRLFAAIALAAATVAATTASAAASASSGPPYPCAATGGPNADASAIGWLGNGAGRDGVPRRQLLRPERHQHDLRIRRLQLRADELDECRRLPARPRHQLRVGRRAGVHHELRRPGGAGRPPLRADLQPRRGAQPDQPERHRRSAADAGPGPAERRFQPGGPRRDGRPRLRGGGGQVRRNLRLAVHGAAPERGRLRRALRAHAGLLGRSAQPDRPAHAAGQSAGRRVEGGLHLHADRPERQRPGHRDQRLPPGVRARRRGHPRLSLRRGLLHRRARAARRDRPGGRDEHAVRGRHLGLPVAVGRLRREDRRHEIPRRPLQLPGPAGREGASRASRRPRTTSPRPARVPAGSSARPTTSTPTGTGRATTTRPCSAWPATSTSRRRSATRPRRAGRPRSTAAC